VSTATNAQGAREQVSGDAGDSAMDLMTPSNHLDFRKLAAVVWTQLLAEFPKAQLY
jgi:hypothetical protein